MGRNITPNEGHFNRNDRFRYEEDVTNRYAALNRAEERSRKTGKIITVMQNTETGLYTIHSHGVDMIGTVVEARFHKGELIYNRLEGQVEAIAQLTTLTEPFAVLDALRGEITGSYVEDLKRLNAAGRTCTAEVYEEAYQMDQQP